MSGIFDSYDDAARHILRAEFYLDAAIYEEKQVEPGRTSLIGQSLADAKFFLSDAYAAVSAISNPRFGDATHAEATSDCNVVDDWRDLVSMASIEVMEAKRIAEEDRWPWAAIDALDHAFEGISMVMIFLLMQNGGPWHSDQ